MDVDDADLMTLLSEQRRELTAAITADSDLDFAFQLQMQEAINISLTSFPSSSSTTLRQPFLRLTEVTDSPSGIAHLLSEQIDNFDRSRRDRELVEFETKRLQVHLNRLIHDQVFARQIESVPENEWRRSGDYIEKPFGESPVSNNEVLRVYVKGLVSEENVLEFKTSFAAIGVAICDVSDRCVFELAKAVEMSGNGPNGTDAVEMKALIEGLNAAVDLGLNRVHVFSDSEAVYHYLTGKGGVPNNNIVALVDQLSVVNRKFAYCGPFLVRRNDMKFVYKLARDAIASQVTKFAENASGKTLLEQCVICFEFIYSGQMFSVNKCLHKYCFSCMRKHVEAKLLQGKLPECPDEKCSSKLEIESCKKFLNPELYDIMSLRVKEASIPATEKVYCPFSNCSALMSKTELQEYGATSSQVTGMRKCVKCYRLLCINCKVPWHDNIGCSDYMSRFPFQSANEAKLKSLATQKHWRECIKCKNLVELAAGCYHIYCRCGYEFCYTCGAEWINKKARCKCPIWDERNLLYAEQNRRGN